MTLRGGLAGRVARLEGAEEGTCPDCRPEHRWICSPEEAPSADELAALEARRCATCSRPVPITFYRWKWDSDTEAAR